MYQLADTYNNGFGIKGLDSIPEPELNPLILLRMFKHKILTATKIKLITISGCSCVVHLYNYVIPILALCQLHGETGFVHGRPRVLRCRKAVQVRYTEIRGNEEKFANYGKCDRAAHFSTYKVVR
jgi:hypothetical protein